MRAANRDEPESGVRQSRLFVLIGVCYSLNRVQRLHFVIPWRAEAGITLNARF